MIANYGYEDGEGRFYITIDQGRCGDCTARPCLPACPASVFVMEEDPYGEVVAAVAECKRKRLQYECMPCKLAPDRPPLPCVAACPFDAVTHSW